jgi:hypothetical protein
VFVDHYVIVKKFKEKMNSLLKGEKERYPVKERPNILFYFILFLQSTNLSKKQCVTKTIFGRFGAFNC